MRLLVAICGRQDLAARYPRISGMRHPRQGMAGAGCRTKRLGRCAVPWPDRQWQTAPKNATPAAAGCDSPPRAALRPACTELVPLAHLGQAVAPDIARSPHPRHAWREAAQGSRKRFFAGRAGEKRKDESPSLARAVGALSRHCSYPRGEQLPKGAALPMRSQCDNMGA